MSVMPKAARIDELRPNGGRLAGGEVGAFAIRVVRS